MLRISARREDGFTLIELVMTVAILGVVVATLIGVVFSYLRVSTETGTRLNESTDQQFVSAYWQQDVSSLGLHDAPTGGVVPTSQSVWVGSAPGCAPATGTPVVMLSWKDYKNVPSSDPSGAWGASQNEATYYTQAKTNANGTSQTQLWRRRCGDTTSDFLVARYLTGTPSLTCYDNAGATTACTGSAPLPARLTLSLTVQDRSRPVHNSTGYANMTLTAQRRQG